MVAITPITMICYQFSKWGAHPSIHHEEAAKIGRETSFPLETHPPFKQPIHLPATPVASSPASWPRSGGVADDAVSMNGGAGQTISLRRK